MPHPHPMLQPKKQRGHFIMHVLVKLIVPETPPRAKPFDKAHLSLAEGLWTGLSGLIPAYA